jgi:hypothetical protein
MIYWRWVYRRLASFRRRKGRRSWEVVLVERRDRAGEGRRARRMRMMRRCAGVQLWGCG